MVHLSVAIARFVETLLWAIFRVAGALTLAVVAITLAGALVFGFARWAIVRRR